MNITEFKDSIKNILNNHLKEFFNFKNIEIKETKTESDGKLNNYDLKYSCSTSDDVPFSFDKESPELITIAISWNKLFTTLHVQFCNENLQVNYKSSDKYHYFYIDAFEYFLMNQTAIIYSKTVQEKLLKDLNNMNDDKMNELKISFRDNKLQSILD